MRHKIDDRMEKGKTKIKTQRDLERRRQSQIDRCGGKIKNGYH